MPFVWPRMPPTRGPAVLVPVVLHVLVGGDVVCLAGLVGLVCLACVVSLVCLVGLAGLACFAGLAG